MILFDGMYSLISLILSLCTLWISNYINIKECEKFPFGKHILEPLIISLNSLVIIMTCVYSLIEGVKDILKGGSALNHGYAIVYVLFSSISCFIIYKYISRNGKNLSSEILLSESNQWLMDSLLSTGALIGFVIALLLKNTPINYILQYTDSIMVIVMAIIFLKLPIKMFINSFKEIIWIKADDGINNDIRILVKAIQDEYAFKESVIKVSKVGRALRIEIDFIFGEECKMKQLQEMDCVRELLYSQMNHIKYKKCMSISFTGNKKWAI